MTDLLGPPPPHWFVSHHGGVDADWCGPRTKLGWLGRLVPDHVGRYRLEAACMYHDWHYTLIGIMRAWRSGDHEAATRLMSYEAHLRFLRWAGAHELDADVLTALLDFSRADADAWFRVNLRRLLQSQGAGVFVSWLVSFVYWRGVRRGGFAST